MIKKIISIVLTITLIFSVSSLIGCKNKENRPIRLEVCIARKNENMEWEYTDYVLYNKGTDKNTLKVEYDNTATDMFITAEAFYDDTNEYIPLEKATRRFVDGFFDKINVLGTHVLNETYPDGNFSLIFTVFENRPMPDIVFDGGIYCLESDGEKFTYRYDGQRHFPSVKILYQGEELLSYNNDSMMYHVFDVQIWNGEKFIDKPEDSIISSQDVGIYKFHFYVGREQLPDDYEHTFREIGKDLVIEIIE